MKHHISIAIVISVFTYISVSPDAHARIWTNDKGNQFEGELSKVEGDIAVIIRDSDKKIFRAPLTIFIQEDQEFIREFVRNSAEKKAAELDSEGGLSEIEVKALEFQRAERLEKAAEEESPAKRGHLLADAGILLLQIDGEKAGKELNKILKEYGKEDYSEVGAKVLLAQANHVASKVKEGDEKAWRKAEDLYKEVWEKFPGVYSEKGCEAANIVAEHYLSLGDTERAIELKKIVIDKRGANGVLGGEACLWLAEHYESIGDEVKAFSYLNEVATTYKTTKAIVQKANVRMEALKKASTE